MINQLLYRLTANRRIYQIELNGLPYLERYYLGQAFGVTFYLHRFLSSDSERHLHNHPWSWGRAIVLAGGYDEEFVRDICPHAGEAGCITARRKIRWYNRVNGNWFHRIHNAKPGTWTLFFHGPRVTLPNGSPKGWGFLQAVTVGATVDRVQTTTVFTAVPPARGNWWERNKLAKDAGRAPL